MRKKMLAINIISILILSFSCQKDDPIIRENPNIDCCEEDTTNKETIPFLEFQWKQLVLDKVDGDVQWLLNYGIINTPHGVALNYDGQTTNGVAMFDKENGNLLWRWESDKYMASFHYHKGINQFVLHDWGNSFVLDCKNGTLVNEFQQNKERVSNPFCQLIGDYLYYTRLNNEDTKAWLVKSHISDLQNWEVLYTINQSQLGGSNPNIQSYNLWTDPISNDEIMVFQHRVSKPNRVDLVGYNLTADTILWKHNDLCPNGISNDQQIQIFMDKAYFLGGNTIYCIDMKTGEVLWLDRHLDPLRSYLFGDVVYAEQEDLIILKDDGTRLTAYEPESGNVVWEISGLTHNGVDITYFDGYVYIAHKPLFAVDAQTGEVFKYTKQSFAYQGMVAIDEENRKLFTVNISHLYAFEIEE